MDRKPSLARLVNAVYPNQSNMDQLTLNLDHGELFDQVCSLAHLRLAFKQVKRNRGAPGIDDVSVDDFAADLDSNLRTLRSELVDWRYSPSPVKRCEIPKPGSTKKRILGIPCVRDRVLQQALKLVLEPIFDPDFSESSFGYRPGRSPRDAVAQAQELVKSGRDWVVDIDLATFFDTINHDRVIHLVGKRVTDTRILRLIGLTLRSGTMASGQLIETSEGAAQGSPLSPLLSNIILHELDVELVRRGLSFCRYADDCNIFVRSRRAAERVLDSVSRFIEGRLKLQVNREKSKAAHCSKVKFLGMTVIGSLLVISAVSMQRARVKLRELIPRRSHIPFEVQVAAVNRWYQGWSGYYGMTNVPSQLRTIEARIRVRFRIQFLRNQKRRKYVVRKLVKRGVRRGTAYKAVYTGRRGWWALAHTFAAGQAWSPAWFATQGLHVVSDEERPHWQPVETYVKVL